MAVVYLSELLRLMSQHIFYQQFLLVVHMHITYPLHSNLMLWKLHTTCIPCMCLSCNLFIANHLYIHSYYKICLNMHIILCYTLYTKNRVSRQAVLNFLKFCATMFLLCYSTQSSLL